MFFNVNLFLTQRPGSVFSQLILFVAPDALVIFDFPRICSFCALFLFCFFNHSLPLSSSTFSLHIFCTPFRSSTDTLKTQATQQPHVVMVGMEACVVVARILWGPPRVEVRRGRCWPLFVATAGGGCEEKEMLAESDFGLVLELIRTVRGPNLAWELDE